MTAPRISFGACDCCDAHRVLHRGEASGLEAHACAVCRFGSLSDDLDDLEDLLEQRLAAKPEIGEQHAEIAAIEAALIEARADFNEHHGQFGMGA